MTSRFNQPNLADKSREASSEARRKSVSVTPKSVSPASDNTAYPNSASSPDQSRTQCGGEVSTAGVVLNPESAAMAAPSKHAPNVKNYTPITTRFHATEEDVKKMCTDEYGMVRSSGESSVMDQKQRDAVEFLLKNSPSKYIAYLMKQENISTLQYEESSEDDDDDFDLDMSESDDDFGTTVNNTMSPSLNFSELFQNYERLTKNGNIGEESIKKVNEQMKKYKKHLMIKSTRFENTKSNINDDCHIFTAPPVGEDASKLLVLGAPKKKPVAKTQKSLVVIKPGKETATKTKLDTTDKGGKDVKPPISRKLTVDIQTDKLNDKSEKKSTMKISKKRRNQEKVKEHMDADMLQLIKYHEIKSAKFKEGSQPQNSQTVNEDGVPITILEKIETIRKAFKLPEKEKTPQQKHKSYNDLSPLEKLTQNMKLINKMINEQNIQQNIMENDPSINKYAKKGNEMRQEQMVRSGSFNQDAMGGSGGGSCSGGGGNKYARNNTFTNTQYDNISAAMGMGMINNNQIMMNQQQQNQQQLQGGMQGGMQNNQMRNSMQNVSGQAYPGSPNANPYQRKM